MWVVDGRRKPTKQKNITTLSGEDWDTQDETLSRYK